MLSAFAFIIILDDEIKIIAKSYAMQIYEVKYEYFIKESLN